MNIIHQPSIVESENYIDAVTSHNTMPFFKFISSLHPSVYNNPKQPLHCLELPISIAEQVSNFASYGHLQTYAIEIIKQQIALQESGVQPELSPEKFESLIQGPGTDYFKFIDNIDTAASPKFNFVPYILGATKNIICRPKYIFPFLNSVVTDINKTRIFRIDKEL